MQQVPKVCRSGYRLRAMQPGLDLPCFFIDGIKALDPKLYFIYHPYRVLWDDVINQYEGDPNNPRYVIGRHPDCGEQEIWGFVLTNGKGEPLLDGRWHIWRLCEPRGWAHVVPIDYRTGPFFEFCLDRLRINAEIVDKYGPKAWNRYLHEEERALQEAGVQSMHELFVDTQKENKWLLRTAMENFQRGIVAPTNPQKESIMGYAGQSNKSRIIRPLDDHEGGLIVPDTFK